MKRWAFSFGIGLAVLFLGTDAQAICQKCVNEFTPDAMCLVIDACENGATMSACVEQPMAGGEWCNPVGSVPGPECNG